jgi:hypothetical protein
MTFSSHFTENTVILHYKQGLNNIHTYTPRDVQHRVNDKFIFSGRFYDLSE